MILQESAALLIRSSQDFGQIRICRPANWSIWNDLLNWNLPFSLLAEQMRGQVRARTAAPSTRNLSLYRVRVVVRCGGGGGEWCGGSVVAGAYG